MSRLRVCIDARLVSGASGGLESVVIGLASAFSRLDGEEEYLFLTYGDGDEWLRPYLRGPCRALPVRPTARDLAKRWINRLFPVVRRDVWRKLERLARLGRQERLPASEGTPERAGAALMHFTLQSAFTTALPSIYHPHDLQHVHLASFFDAETIRARELRYRAFCERAAMVAVTSTWVKHDVETHYGLPPGKVQVVELAPVNTEYPVPSPDQLAEITRRMDLPEGFFFYPAQTWPHKNHLGLVEALAALRDRHGLRRGVVCSGRLTEHHAEIMRRARALGVDPQIRFLGFVSPLELQCLYARCTAVIVPTLFEAASGPLWEAFLAGAPAACSNVTSLPAQAGDAAIVFDPRSTGEIADAMRRLATDEDLRRTLIARGRESVARFRWDRSARHFRAHYRRLTGRELTGEDRALLAAPPML